MAIMMNNFIHKKESWIIGVLLVVLASAIVYGGMMQEYFLNDDFLVLFAAATKGIARDFFPFLSFLPRLLVSVEFFLWKLRPEGYHVVSLVLFVGNALLLYVLLMKLGGKRVYAGVTSLLFALYPTQTPLISSVVEQPLLLATTFLLGAIVLYLTSRSTKQMREKPMRANMLFVCSVLCFLLSALLHPVGLLFVMFVGAADAIVVKTKNSLAAYSIVLCTFAISLAMGQRMSRGLGVFWEFIRALPQVFLFRLFNPAILPREQLFPYLELFGLLLLIFLVLSLRSLFAVRAKKIRAALSFFLIWIAGSVCIFFISDARAAIYLISIGWCAMVGFVLTHWKLYILPSRVLRVVTGVAILLFLGFGAYKNTIPWTQAADVSRDIPEKFEKKFPTIETRTSCYVLNAPEVVAGIPVYQEGLAESIQLFYMTHQSQPAASRIEIFQVHTGQGSSQGSSRMDSKQAAQAIKKDSNRVVIATWNPDTRVFDESFNLDSIKKPW